LKFVNALIQNTRGDGKEGEEFWTKAETLLYSALIAYIVNEVPVEWRNMITLVDMLNRMEVKENDSEFKNTVDYMFLGLAKRKPNCFAVRQYEKFRLSSGEISSKRCFNRSQIFWHQNHFWHMWTEIKRRIKEDYKTFSTIHQQSLTIPF
jgi:hypothetical protein